MNFFSNRLSLPYRRSPFTVEVSRKLPAFLMALGLPGLVLTWWPQTADASPTRSVAAVSWAIAQTSKTSPNPALRREFARSVLEEAARRRADPYTLIAIIHNESRFNPHAIDPEGMSIGLGQYRLDRLPECRESLQHPVCQRKKELLLDWRYAIQQIGADIEVMRKYCRKRTGHEPLLHRWLAMYQGVSSKSRVCGMHKVKGKWVDAPRAAVTQKVMRYRQWLIRHQP